MTTGFKVSGDYADASSAFQRTSNDGYATKPEQERLLTVLPSGDDLRSMFIKSMRSHAHGVELMEIKQPASHRVWLTSDPEGPGYGRQKSYGFLWIDHEDYLCLDEPKVADKLRALALGCVDELARDIAGRVSTFRAYNELYRGEAVTVRGLRNTSPGYLMKRGADTFVRVAETTDQFYLIVGSYFVVCPPGEEWIAPSEPTK